MKYRRTNKVGEFEVQKAKNKGAVSKNVVRVAISPRSPFKYALNQKSDQSDISQESPLSKKVLLTKGERENKV